jgi:exosome complex RNA-binding protein Rrp42 (RNase PH superfamily)
LGDFAILVRYSLKPALTYFSEIISDPTSFEEPLLDSSVMVILSENKVASVSQLGSRQGHPASLIETCVATARARQSAVIQALQ